MTVLASGILGLTTSDVCHAGQYKLAPGDTVEIAIGGLSDQRNRAQIQIDGTIPLPGGGTAEVAGLTPAEMQSRIETLLQGKVLRQRLTDGRDQAFVVKPGDVMASVAEYRPIYVSGDVLTPGQQVYRASMTVRQAVAVAGGFSLLRSRGTQPGATDPADLLRDYQSLATEYTKEYFHIVRTSAELDGRDTFDASPPNDISLPAGVIASVVKAEQASLKTSQSDYVTERRFLEDAVKQTDDQFATLKKQQEGEERGVQADEEELERVMKAFGSGLLASPRVSESRRALLLSSTRRLQTSVELMRLQRQREDFLRQAERVSSQRTINLLREQKESSVRLADLRVRMQALSQKLQPLGGSGAIPVGTSDLHPDVIVVRRSGQRWDRIVASVDFDVEPGDVIEVTLRPVAANLSN
ncbi:polysaccharide biosynthesis/export family protein [Bradyrhizobium lablabi]|uniref:polysaccharide biosynthesis/export family protein n=1 Tax=Bradyrhizobium lablabi TaxID=722472 RepID=UPI001BA7E1B5|nr:polysaccharide biosynthesis/export family protein [Bradyrhizobium lablabi]MBR0695043.1 polysaccharide biosynthesis/export family protein [Bradyrhizobium lablabi]